MKLNWFEIGVTNMNRAITFYEAVFGVKINLQDFGGTLMGFFPKPTSIEMASGSLIKHESYVPNEEGVLLYFYTDDITSCLERVTIAGGKVLQNKTQINEEHGCMGVFLDSEGNRIALHGA